MTTTPLGEAPAHRRLLSAVARPSGAHLLVALATIAAVVANYAVLRARDASVPVAVVAATVEAGHAVTPDQLVFTAVHADDPVLATLVRREEVAELRDRVAAGPLIAGELLRHRDLVPAGTATGQRAMSLPIPPAHAVAGSLVRGDRIDVIEVRGGRARYLVAAAEVLAVGDRGQAGGLAGPASPTITLAVDDETALRLALAFRDGDIDLVRSTGAAPATVMEIHADTADGAGP